MPLRGKKSNSKKARPCGLFPSLLVRNTHSIHQCVWLLQVLRLSLRTEGGWRNRHFRLGGDVPVHVFTHPMTHISNDLVFRGPSNPCEQSITSCSHCQMVLTPGSPSPLRPRKPSAMATISTFFNRKKRLWGSEGRSTQEYATRRGDEKLPPDHIPPTVSRNTLKLG